MSVGYSTADLQYSSKLPVCGGAYHLEASPLCFPYTYDAFLTATVQH
jgi:hypothetical protein